MRQKLSDLMFWAALVAILLATVIVGSHRAIDNQVKGTKSCRIDA